MSKLILELRDAKKQLDQVKLKWDQEKAQLLIDALINAGGQRDCIKMIRDKGIPNYIFIDDKASKELENVLSWFAPVSRHGLLKSPSLTFHWGTRFPLFDKPTFPDFFAEVKQGDVQLDKGM